MKIIQMLILSILFVITSMYAQTNQELPKNFVFLSSIDPTIIENVRYSTDQNFLGRPIVGYKTHKIVCTKEAALALKKAHEALKKRGFSLVVYDAYRPQRSVDEFKKWGKDINDTVSMEYYYPTIKKKDVFRLGYVAEKSSHSRGSTFDLTLIEKDQKLNPITYSKRTLNNDEVIPFLDDNTVDMGSSFDLFHEVSHPSSQLVTETQSEMRKILSSAMIEAGFKIYDEEWWHFTLEKEPYPDTYFDFVVK